VIGRARLPNNLKVFAELAIIHGNECEYFDACSEPLLTMRPQLGALLNVVRAMVMQTSLRCEDC
jgi:hypothetical protein